VDHRTIVSEVSIDGDGVRFRILVSGRQVAAGVAPLEEAAPNQPPSNPWYEGHNFGYQPDSA
jgi:hypothetical protein